MPETEPPKIEVQVYETILEEFNLSELKELCTYLRVNYEDLPGEERKSKVRELVAYFERRKALPKLVEGIKKRRPDSTVEGRANSRNHVLIAHISLLPLGSPGSIREIPSVKAIEEASQRDNPPRKTIEIDPHTTDNDLILLAHDGAVEMVHLVLNIAQEAKTRDIALRIGLHSNFVQQAANSTAADVEALIKSARQIVQLGKAGHILSTRQFAEIINAAHNEDWVVTYLGKKQISNQVRVELYNIYSKSGAFGNSTNPDDYVALVRSVKFPDRISCSKQELLSIEFFPNVAYVKIKFTFKNSNIRISGEQPCSEECTFEYFRKDDQYNKVFEIWTVQADATTLEPIDISFYDEEGESVSSLIRGRILFRRFTPANSIVRLPLSAWDRFVCIPWWLLVLAGVLILVASGTYLALRYDEDDRRRFKERILIATIWPSSFKGDWPEEFINPQSNSLNPKNWKATPSQWTLTEGQGRDTSNKALFVTGSGVGFNYLGRSSLYDFDLSLEMIVVDGQQNASWVLRAKDQGDYYLFVLDFAPGNGTQALLRGFVVEKGRKVGEMVPVQIGYFFPFSDKTLLYIDIQVRDNQFAHRFRIAKAQIKDGRFVRDLNQPQMNKSMPLATPATLTDPERHYRYGLIGFTVDGQGGEMKVDTIRIKNAQLIKS